MNVFSKGEKPMTLNSKEQEEVLTTAKNKNVFFMEVKMFYKLSNFYHSTF